MNIDTNTRYCHGAKMQPATDSIGRQVDECIYCHRSVLFVRTEPVELHVLNRCGTCGKPSGGPYCRNHRDPVDRENYALRLELGLDPTRGGSCPGRLSLKDYAAQQRAQRSA